MTIDVNFKIILPVLNLGIASITSINISNIKDIIINVLLNELTPTILPLIIYKISANIIVKHKIKLIRLTNF